MYVGKNTAKTKPGFTIVELLIVIVVIGILAAITIVSYNGIQDRAKSVAAQSDVSQNAKLLEVYKGLTSTTDQYPATAALANLKSSGGATLSYTASSAGKGYCLASINGSTSYYTTSTLKAPQKGNCVTADGLMGWWPLNGDTSDASGNGHPGILSLSAPTPTTGQGNIANTAYSFDGSVGDAYIDTGDKFAANQFTASVWAYPIVGSNGTGFATIMSNTRDCCNINSGFQIQYTKASPNQLSGFIWAGGTGAVAGVDYSTGSPSGLPQNTWSHIALTYNGMTISMYKNGTLLGSSTSYSGTLPTPLYNVFLGRMGEIPYGYTFGGKLDDARIYNRALSATEITALYSAGAL